MNHDIYPGNKQRTSDVRAIELGLPELGLALPVAPRFHAPRVYSPQFDSSCHLFRRSCFQA